MVVGDLATQVDLAILGAGPGGYVAAIRAAQLGLDVALIDPQPPGGACLHATCIPARTLLHAVAAATAEADVVVVTGRWHGQTSALQLEEVGLEPDQFGFLPVDLWQHTANPRILAVGDVTGPPFLAGLASQQGEAAAEVCAGRPSASDPRAIPHVIWTTPQVAMVGLTRAGAEAAGYDVVEGRFPLSASGAARIAGTDEGVTLVVAETESGVVLGVTMVGPAAAERIGQAALALEMGATLTDLQATLQPHPTFAETIPEAAADALGRAIHLYRPG